MPFDALRPIATRQRPYRMEPDGIRRFGAADRDATLEHRMWILRAHEPAVSFRLLPGEIRTIGRAAGAQFVVEAPLVSRVHCRLTCAADGGLLVEDLGSTNGTYVDQQRVEGAVSLAPGATLTVGRVGFEVSRAEGWS